MKAFTDIKQSKKLAEILPVKSADMFFADGERPAIWNNKDAGLDDEDIPCWSLAALLEVIPKQLGRYTLTFYWCDDSWCCSYIDDGSEIKETSSANNPVDATVEMVIKLIEKDLL